MNLFNFVNVSDYEVVGDLSVYTWCLKNHVYLVSKNRGLCLQNLGSIDMSEEDWSRNGHSAEHRQVEKESKINL